IEMLLDGTEGGNMFDNITINTFGQVLLQEDVGNAAHNGKIWEYDVATDSLVMLAQHNPALFGDVGVPATPPFNQDEKSSGTLDVSSILGPGASLFVVQAHYSPGDPELVEGGQFLLMRVTGPTAGLLDGNLVVHGSPDSDFLAITLQADNFVAVDANGQRLGDYDLSAVRSITVNGSDGRDVIYVDARLAIN